MSTTMQKHTITAFYDSRDYANSAAAKLRQSGIAAADVIVSPETVRDELGVRADQAGYAEPKRTGFWAALEDMFGGTEDHDTYAEGIRRGNVMLTAHVDDNRLDHAIAILEEHGSIDLDEHEQTWRSEGWTGGTTGAVLATTAVAGAGAEGLAMTGAAPAATVVTTETRKVASAPVAPALKVATPVAATPVAATARAGDDVLQVVEERLNVGKRAVSRGKVRLHSYVVEKAVSEDVSLHRETVTVDRHAVDRPVATLDAAAFRDRTIEMEEIDEVAVVAKTARVVEEIGIRKDGVDRTETVTDTLRSTKVDIEDDRSTGLARGVTEGSDGGRIVARMDVIASDGTKIGTVDHMDGPERIKLARTTSPDGQHHIVPMAWVDHVDRHVHLKKTAAEVKAGW